MTKTHVDFQLLILCFAALILLAGCSRSQPSRPNILLIMTDQQPVSCLGAYGNQQIKTPYLDQLAKEGHLLRNFYIAAFPCSPSRASILSGRYLHHHNVSTNNVLMDPNIPVMGKILAETGYRTGYFGKAHLGGSMYVGRTGGDGIDYLHTPGGTPDPVGDAIRDYWYLERIETDSGWATKRHDGGPGEDQAQLGFEFWKGGWKHYKDWLIDQGQEAFAYVAGNHDDYQSAPEGEHMFSQLGPEYHMAHFFTDQAEHFIQENDQKPWTAVLSYFGPHLPVAPPRPWDTLFSLSEVPLPPNFHDDLKDKPRRQKEISSGYFQGPWTDDQYKDYIRRYWGYCGYIDEEIGRIFHLLKKSGQWENTLIVFTSDHGDMLAAHSMIFKLGSNGYDELFRVPAIFKIPGTSGVGSKYDALTSSIDILPTILHAAQIPVPPGVDGKNLFPIFNDQQNSVRDFVFSEIHGTGIDGKTIMCRNKQFKYVYHWLSEDVDELYDLQTDPGELVNLVKNEQYLETIRYLQNAIIRWSRETQHQYADLISKKASL